MSDTGFRLLFYAPHRAQVIFNIAGTLAALTAFFPLYLNMSRELSLISWGIFHSSIAFSLLSSVAFIIGGLSGKKIIHAGLNLALYLAFVIVRVA